MNFMFNLYIIKFIKFKPIIQFKKFELQNCGFLEYNYVTLM